jgi:Uma2 family endonuclease
METARSRVNDPGAGFDERADMDTGSALREIVLPETTPETEWVRGRALQEVSPTRRHAIVQLAVAIRLRAWSRRRGEVGTEWRFRITPPGDLTRPLVPDVAYVSYERLATLSDAEREVPPFAPDIVVEIRSPDDRQADIDHKRDVYLSDGAGLLLFVDPDRRTMDVFEGGAGRRSYAEGDTYVSERFSGLTIALAEIFADLDPPSH